MPYAAITVTPGPLTMTTDLVGHYSMYGVPADAQFHITAFGYEPLVQDLSFNNHATRNFQLTPVNQLPDLAGLYTLSVDVIDGCQNPTPLPEALQHRRYDAVVGQNHVALDVTLTEPRFRLGPAGAGRRFAGRVAAAGATFSISDNWSDSDSGTDYPNVVEQLADGTVLVLGGDVVTTGSAAGLSGTLNGSLAITDPRIPVVAGDWRFFSSSCHGRLGFTLTRR